MISVSKSNYFISTKLLSSEISHNILKADPDSLECLLELPEPHTIASLPRVIFSQLSPWVKKVSDKL